MRETGNQLKLIYQQREQKNGVEGRKGDSDVLGDTMYVPSSADRKTVHPAPWAVPA